MKENLVREKSYQFALRIIELCKVLLNNNEYVLSKQLLRSGTSIGANIEEAIAGQSRADFLSKMSISSKEARESRYWLRLLSDSKTLDAEIINPVLADAEELINIITAIVKTTALQKNVNKF